jgi:translation initiation factor 1
MRSKRSKKSNRGASNLVYSTDGRATSDGVVRLHRETKGRKGKGVTLVKGLGLGDVELATLAKTLKSACGVGGAVKSGVIELQTSEREKIMGLLEAAGFTVKIAGG